MPDGAVQVLISDEQDARTDPSFQAILAENTVGIADVVRAKAMASRRLTDETAECAIGEKYYPLLLASFQKAHKAAQIVIQEDVGFGVVLHTGEQADPAGDKINWVVIRRTLRFDWTLPRALLIETQELADEARRWLANPRERRDLLGLLYNVMTQIGATIGRENRLCPATQDEAGEPSSRINQDVAIIRRQLDAARAQFRRDVERSAQAKYAYGMGIGAAIMLLICGAIAGILALEDIEVVNAVGLAAGAVGACVSVLERMTKGKLDVNAQSGGRRLLVFGSLRPLVGGVFGYLIYLIIRAELISIFVLPKQTGPALAYVAVFAFVAGFNERFAQDVLANASNTRRED